MQPPIPASLVERGSVTWLVIVAAKQASNKDRVNLPFVIVTELVINALKHAFPTRERAGHITVEYWSRPTGWRLTVEDNGVGMPGDHLKRKSGPRDRYCRCPVGSA
jgi:LytS/YehU family sensor histidine kinase